MVGLREVRSLSSLLFTADLDSDNWFITVAGTLESLAAMAHCHLDHGVASPFLVRAISSCIGYNINLYESQHTPRPFTHPSLTSLRAALRFIGEAIANEGTPKILGPFVVGLTG